MGDRDFKDLASSLVLILLGGSSALYAWSHYALGSIRQPGPGAFPTVLGALLVVFGVLIGIPALRREGTLPQFELVPFAAVVLSVIAFSMLIEPFGLVPSIVALVVIATVPEKRLSWTGKLLLAVGLSISCAVIFILGLGLTLELAKWPY
ncbi:hypothetical protein LL06_25220 [Hoeflea sp. BAL378]|uniref:tripartite tricarboxylate transporter TctB family protein n=1 Tax=Hoeflea sp. BAL378 TaxID=1547437 RepID=UPI0005130F33|nr:tripartite tricarboxylate transporter TctB family protein [Hoeflea sp. BAL378]KGF66941.1 hypothetical protein LL06_25220 [Hoeflea sp. BAL378]